MADAHDADEFEKTAGELGARNRKWRDEKVKEDPEYFERCKRGQAPKYLWIGCCDSRVAVENLVGAEAGELFVHRNIANMAICTDVNMRCALQYAVDYLMVDHIVVCGHYECGGVKAAITNKDHSSPLESWLSHIRDIYRLHREELDAIKDKDDQWRRLVELNVVEQCLNLFKTGEVQKRRLYTAQRPHRYKYALPRIHGMVYDPGDGILRRIPINWKTHLDEFSDVYNLYQPDDFLNSILPP